ncbi:MAG: carbon starvation protein A [Planctomycetales bacterium 4572_13]|nr:MAG: carbon starvation protein A [Planctomycetales bacterium 4572_13]
MDALLLMVVCFGGYILAYHTYGRFLARRIFKLRGDAPVPSHERNDGVDFVPTRKGIIFGHHFTSIAGTGPIVGPAIGIIWGWLPALLWVFFGSIFMGAVHDFGSLVVSLRNDGKSISEIAARYINKRVRLIFFIIVFLALLIIIAIFGIVIATVFKLYPESVTAVWLEIPIAIILGWAIYKKSANIKLATIVAVAAMYVGVVLGAWLEHVHPGLTSFPADFAIPPTGMWTIILLIYAWVASTLPVTTLLQPRDYINAWQLAIMMALLAAGVVASALFGGGDFKIVAPAINQVGPDIPPMMPMMFVTIACGAISGFHSLVAGGTSSKQLTAEPDAQFVGYGSMLTEGALAVLVILCICAGLGMGHEGQTGSAAWQGFYNSWMGGKGLGDKLQPVVIGASNMMGSLGIPQTLGFAIMGVFIASFAGTTLDTAVRIQRYVVGELAEDLKLPKLSNRWTATTIAVITAAALAFVNTRDGKITFGANALGALKLWPLFGTVNQLLAALALLVITMYLKKQGGLKYLVAGIPCIIMLIVTGGAMVLNERTFYEEKNVLLIVIGGAVFLLAVWMTAETLILFCRNKTTASKPD